MPLVGYRNQQDFERMRAPTRIAQLPGQLSIRQANDFTA